MAWLGQIEWASVLRQWAVFLLGYMLPIAFCYLYFGTRFHSIIFSDYGTATAAYQHQDWTTLSRVVSMCKGWLMCIRLHTPAFLLFFAAIPLVLQQHRLWQWLFCLFGYIGFSLALYFVNSTGGHYTLLMLPFACLGIGLVLSLKVPYAGWRRCAVHSIAVGLVLINCLWPIYRVYGRYMPLYLSKFNEGWQCDVCAQWLNNNVPSHSRVWVVPATYEAVYLLADIVPPNISTIGYSFGPLGINHDEALLQLADARYVVVSTRDAQVRYYNFMPEILDSLNTDAWLWHEVDDSLFCCQRVVR